MTIPSEIIARQMHLPRALTHDVICEEDLRVPMDDGVELLADRWVAGESATEAQPTVLVRSPYGRKQFVGLLFGRLLAERGLQVVVQSVRGTFGSGGRFSPFDERADGLATLRWIRAQAWHSERIGTIGPSYLGLVQWAIAPDAGDDLAALSIQVSASQFHGQTYAGGSLSLETSASWLVLVAEQERRFAPLATVRALRRLPALLRRAAARRPGPARDRRRSRLVPRGAGASRRARRLVGVARLRGGRLEGHRAGAVHRRLVRHLPPVDARGLRGAARGRPRTAADHRALDAHRPGTGGNRDA